MVEHDKGVNLFFKGIELLIPFFLLCICFSLFPQGDFLQLANLKNLVFVFLLLLIVALGEGMVLVTGEIDFSIGAIGGLTGVLCAWLIAQGIPLWLGILIPLLVGAGLGISNGLFVSKVGVNSLLITIATGLMVRGLAWLGSGGKRIWLPYEVIPEKSKIFPLWAIILLAIGIGALGYLLFTRTDFKERLLVAGEKKRKGVGKIEDKKTICQVYLLTGLLAGLGGLIWMLWQGYGAANAGEHWSVIIISGLLLGGIREEKEIGFGGGLIGLLMVIVLTNGLSLLGITGHSQLLFLGIMLLLAVIVDRHHFA